MNLSIRASKLAVHVAQQRGGDHGMIKRRIKSLLEIFVRGFRQANTLKAFLPLLAAPRHGIRNFQCRNFGVSDYLRAPSTLTVDKPTRTRICSPALVLKSKWPLVSLPVVWLPATSLSPWANARQNQMAAKIPLQNSRSCRHPSRRSCGSRWPSGRSRSRVDHRSPCWRCRASNQP